MSLFRVVLPPNRGHVDNVLIAQDIVHYMHTQERQIRFFLYIYKINFEKAYDCVDSNFLEITLVGFGFPTLTIDLIMICITFSFLSLKWNDEKLNNFTPTHGLRQGDYMSLIILALYGEVDPSYSGKNRI